MSNIIDHIPLTDAGMDFDSAPRYMSKGDSRYNLNILKGEDNFYGEVTNLKGNRKVTYELGDSNTYFVAWSCYDPLTRNVYFYIFSQPYDTSGSGDYEYDNRFVRFNEDSEEITTLFYDTKNYFGVDPAIRVKDSFVLGDWLFYNPQTSEPKIIDLTRIYNYTTYDAYDATLAYTYGRKVTYFGGLFRANQVVAIGEDPVNYDSKWDRIGDSYQDATDIEFDSEFRYAFNQIKHIPVSRPICAYATDPDKNANNVRGKLLRFSHGYKYFDNSYSRYGAYSDVTLPQYDEYYNGEVPGDLDQYNCIDIRIPLHSAALIKEIDIIFQETGGDWKRAKIINRQDIVLLNQIYYTYRFYNTDSAFDQIDDDHFLEPYDALPREANSMEIINKNILCFGGIKKEGFQNIDKNDIDVTLTPEIEDIGIEDSIDTIINDLILTPDGVYEYMQIGPFEQEVWYIQMDLTTWYPNGIANSDIFRATIDGRQVQYTIAAGDVASVDALSIAIGVFLQGEFPIMEWTGGAGFVTGYSASITECVFYHPSGVAQTSLTKKRGFKTGAWHPFCIFYYDAAMRRWDAQTSKDHPDGVVTWSAEGTTVYVPMLGEYSPNDGSTAHKWNINWELNHLPPSEAKWWRWGYAGNALCSQFVQYTITDIGDVGLTSITEPINTTWVNITPRQTIKTTVENDWNKYPNSIIEPYAFDEGDRIRFITKASTIGNELGAVVDGVYDYGIISFDIDTNKLYIQEFGFAVLGIGEDSLVEIYTPIKTDTAKLFYEFGGLMPIIRDGDNVFVHGCGATGLQNQDTITGDPVTGVFKAGDVYHLLRTPSKPIDGAKGWFHESQWYSDFYQSDDWDKGRPGVETDFGERYLNIVRHSKQYLQNTLINGLSTFWGDTDYKELNDVFGDILRIIEIGDTLKVYQRKKPSSILIGRTEYVDAEGRANIVQTSERVLGAIRYSSTNYGTEFPESITRNNRYVYGFDIYNGVMWRDSPNGIFPISGRYESADGTGNYKAETYFKEKAKELLVSGIGGVDVETVWDERHKNLYVIFKDIVTEDNNEAIMFHEPSNRWIGFTNMDQTPENGWTQMIELEWSVLRGFDGGIGYEFDLDTRFAIFNIVTPLDETVLVLKQDLDIDLYVPSIVIDCVVEPTMVPMGIDYIPIRIAGVYYVFVTPSSLHFDADDTAWKSIVVTCNPTTCYLDSIPRTNGQPWVYIEDSWGNRLGAGSAITSGTTLYVFLYSTWIYGAASNSIVFHVEEQGDHTLFTAYFSITLSIGAAFVSPTATIAESSAPNNRLIVNSAVVNPPITLGSNSVGMDLTVTHPDYGFGGTIPVNYDIWINGVSIQTGLFNITDNAPSSILVSFPSYNNNMGLISGDSLVVYLYSPPKSIIPVDAVGSPSVIDSFITPYFSATGIKITYARANVSSLAAFLFTETGVGDAKTLIMTVGDSLQCVLYSYPAWVTVTGEDGTSLIVPPLSSNPLVDRHAIEDEEIIYVYPTVYNTSQDTLSGTLVFLNEYGDTSSVSISQEANPAYEAVSLSTDWPTDEWLFLLTGTPTPTSDPYVIFGASLAIPQPDYVYLYAAFRNILVSDTDIMFTVYWRATIERTGSTVYRGNFRTYNEYWLNGQTMAFPLGTNIVGTDIMEIVFSISYI